MPPDDNYDGEALPVPRWLLQGRTQALIAAGDLVRGIDADIEMLVIGNADEHEWAEPATPSFFCVWECGHVLHEEVFSAEKLTLVRQERRRIPRPTDMSFPGM